jgi:urease accessory protein
VAGDIMSVDVTLEAGAEAVLTTQSAEKVYRSEGGEVVAELDLRLASESRLAWLPQEQILFDGARFRRMLGVDMAENAELTIVESTIFGRVAAGEILRHGSFRDRWRIRRGGRLVFAEDIRLEGEIHAVLARAAVARGGRAIATVLHVAPGTEALCEGARHALDGTLAECGVSVFDGMLVARFLSVEPQMLRRDLVRFLEWLRATPMPRSWQT